MPDQRLSEPTESPIKTPAPQADTPRQSGADSLETNPMQSSSNSPAAPLAPPSSETPNPPQRIPYWLLQTERFVRLYLGLLVGLFVCCAPWCPPVWDNNPLFASSPWLMAIITHGAVRGIVSGLGILNLWITVRVALRRTTDDDSGPS